MKNCNNCRESPGIHNVCTQDSVSTTSAFWFWPGDDGWDEFGLDDVQLASPQPNVSWCKVSIPSFPIPSRQSLESSNCTPCVEIFIYFFTPLKTNSFPEN